MPRSPNRSCGAGFIGTILSSGFTTPWGGCFGRPQRCLHDILKKRGKINYTLILLGKISYGTGSPLFRHSGIFLKMHRKSEFGKNEQICHRFSIFTTNSFVCCHARHALSL